MNAENITTFSEYDRLIHSNFDVVLVLLGGNDIRESCNIAEIYDNLKSLIEDINNTVLPKFGTYLLEPEARIGNPSIVSEKGYFRLRNSLVRKIKARKEINYWTLVGKGLNLNHLKRDGVHFNAEGKKKLKKIIESYLIRNINEKNLKKKKSTQRNRKVIGVKIDSRPSTSTENTRKQLKDIKSSKSKDRNLKYNTKEKVEPQRREELRNRQKSTKDTKKNKKLKKD